MTAAAITRPPMRRLTTVELRKMTDTRSGFWLLVSVGLSALAVVVLVLTVGGSDDRTFDSMFGDCVGIVSVLLPIVGLLLVTSEWSQRTALTTFTLVPERARVVTAKLLAGCALALLAVVASLAFAALGNLIAGGSWDFTLTHLLGGALYELFGMLGALALGLLIMHSAAAIVTYFVLPTVVGIVTNVVTALHGPAKWIEPTQSTGPLADGTVHGADWAHFAVTFGVWVVVPLVAGMLRLRRHELK
jgi:ABC-2 type transport system permease protein